MRIFRRQKLDLFFIFLLCALSFLAWRPLLEMVIRGNGYMYMLSNVQGWFWSRSYTFTGFSSAAAISGALFRKFFGVQMGPYLWTEILVILLIGGLFYWFVRVLTKKSFIAFAASLMFTVNYFGNFDMLVNTCYCYFMERVLNVPFLLISLIFLQLYLDRAKRTYYIVSLLFYFIGIGLGHFSFLFTPIYLVYPFFWFLFKKRRRKDIVKGLMIGSSYLGISLFFLLLQQIHESGYRAAWTFQEFLLNPQKYHYFDNMLRQLVYWSQYPLLVRTFFDIPDFHQNVLSVKNAIDSTPAIAVVYIIASIVIYTKLTQQRAMLLSTIFATASIFFLNSYFGQYAIANQSGTNRYLYFPTFLLSVFWSLFLWAVFWQKRSWLVLIGAVLLATYYIVNITLLGDNFSAVKEWNKPTKAIYQHIVATRNQLKDNTLVLAKYPAIIASEAQFFTEMLGDGKVLYMSESPDTDDWRPFAAQSSHIIRLSYDRTCQCVREEVVK